MPVRDLPVRPDLDQLKHQAKDLVRSIHAGDSGAITELREFHPDPIAPASAKLADAQHGVELPDTPTMALHRGRIDLLEKFWRADPHLVTRTFSHREIYPAEMGCRDEIDATVGTPLGGTTLLHMCMDYDEMEIARWLLAHGADTNVRASIWKRVHPGYFDDPGRAYRDVTALSWGRRFHMRKLVSEPAMRLIEGAVGVE